MDKSPDAFRTISEVAEELDLPQHVLRFWETRFSQIKPLKRGGGRRYYRPDDVALLRGIRALLYGEGYTIKGVQRILKENGPRSVQAMGRGETKIPPGSGFEDDEPGVFEPDVFVQRQVPVDEWPEQIEQSHDRNAVTADDFFASDEVSPQETHGQQGFVDSSQPELFAGHNPLKPPLSFERVPPEPAFDSLATRPRAPAQPERPSPLSIAPPAHRPIAGYRGARSYEKSLQAILDELLECQRLLETLREIDPISGGEEGDELE